jgi:flagellar hook-associated protein 1 FlgK
LSTAINTAQTSLSNTATQTNIVSRNIANASNPDYNRRNAALATTSTARRSFQSSGRRIRHFSSRASMAPQQASGQQTLLTGLTNLKGIFGGNDYEGAPATLLGTMRDTLSTFAAQPGENTLAQIRDRGRSVRLRRVKGCVCRSPARPVGCRSGN